MSESRKRKGKRKGKEGRERKRREGRKEEIDVLKEIERKKENDARSNRFAQQSQSRERCRINDICGWLGGCDGVYYAVAFACRHNDG